jgi:hypothetical protein
MAAVVEKGTHKHLQLAVVPFAHIPLQDLSVDVLSVRAIACREVLLYRDRPAALHTEKINQ